MTAFIRVLAAACLAALWTAGCGYTVLKQDKERASASGLETRSREPSTTEAPIESRFSGPIEVVLQLPTTLLDLNGTLRFSARVSNRSPFPVRRSFSSSCQVGYELYDSLGYRLNGEPGCYFSFTTLELQPGEEREFELFWSREYVPRGSPLPRPGSRCTIVAGVYGPQMQLIERSETVELEAVGN